MKKLLLLLLPLSCLAQPEVIVRGFGDSYSETVKKLESGETSIDYKAFRESFIDSKQFGISQERSKEFDSLQNVMYAGMDSRDYPAVIKACKGLLSIDYTDMMSHKILQQTYKIQGDTVNNKKYHDIEFGLLNSIVKNGDGKSCETAWPVIKVEEEYFILGMLGANVLKQSLITDGNMCDKMDVKLDGKKKTYYFEVSKVFAGYKEMFKEK